MSEVRFAINGGAGPGKLKIYSAAYAALLAVFECSDPCGAVAGDPAALTFSGLPKTTVGLVGGIAAVARITDSDDVMVREGMTVGIAASDIIIDNDNIAVDQTINWTAGVITHG
jgi:hypothetical protein